MNKHNIIKDFLFCLLYLEKLLPTYLVKIIFYVKNDFPMCRCGLKIEYDHFVKYDHLFLSINY